ncbi:MAG: DinB family protein [Sulfuriferula sp.]
MKDSLPYTWKSYFVVQADYQLWANDRLFAALGSLDAALLRSPQGLHFDSIYDTVAHMLSESQGWFARLRNETLMAVNPVAHPDWNRLIEATQEHARALQLWLEHCDDAFFEQQVIYATPTGPSQPLWVRDAITHMMTYLAHHRGQISAIITRLGYRSLEMDYIHYKREMNAYREQLAAIPLGLVNE